ncbi:MAG TPA: aldehyde ferredoxin oxidoreductase N-terminal domain-containing protein [Nitrososphaerales archaeon]|nr:aldehyde ferredoxin oxidoreductase N-terminal domain-containing protein [Nitrososphaerales archaeon]
MVLGGYNGKIAIVDLSLGKVSYEALDEEMLRSFVGGRGLGAKFLWDSPMKNGTTSEDLLGIFTGPLTGTGVPFANRLTMVFLSPLTKTIAYTHTGGYSATALKLAGFDGLLLVGESSTPKYLLVRKDEIVLSGADSIWGMRATDCISALRTRHGDARILSIGPAGEKLVRYANVVNDAGRASGVRHGAGCLMGIKRIKAIVIQSDYSQRLPMQTSKRSRRYFSACHRRSKLPLFSIGKLVRFLQMALLSRWDQ